MNFIYCRRVYMAYKKEKSKRKLPKLLLATFQHCHRMIAKKKEKEGSSQSNIGRGP